MSFLFNFGSQDFENIDINGYKDQFFGEKESHQLIDVRTPGEFVQGHVPNAVNIPLDQLSNRLNEIEKDTPIVLVCATGNRSASAARALARAGYENLYNLKGGTMMWQMFGNPIE